MPTPGSTATGGPSATLCPIPIPPPPRVLIIRTESAELSSAVAAAAVDEYKHNCAAVHHLQRGRCLALCHRQCQERKNYEKQLKAYFAAPAPVRRSGSRSAGRQPVNSRPSVGACTRHLSSTACSLDHNNANVTLPQLQKATNPMIYARVIVGALCGVVSTSAFAPSAGTAAAAAARAMACRTIVTMTSDIDTTLDPLDYVSGVSSLPEYDTYLLDMWGVMHLSLIHI